MAKCSHCENQAIINLDGDDLCKKHAGAWCKGEEQAYHEAQENNPMTSYADRHGH